MSRLSAIARAVSIATAVGAISLAVGATTLLVPDQYPTIQAAIDAAGITGDLVLVSPGTYYENVNVTGKSLDILSTGGPEVTVIDGQRRGSVASIGLGGGGTWRNSLKGFTLQHGRADIGGGVRAGGHVTIEDCVITDNYASHQGGGIAAEGHDAVIRHNTIVLNSSRHSGGGLLSEGVGAVIEENHFERNVAHGGTGGGLSVYGAGTIVSRNVIRRNTCRDCEGGGLAVQEAKEISDNLIVMNRGHVGGGLSVLVGGETKVINNTVADNVATKRGGRGPKGGQLLTGTTSGHLLFANNIFSGSPTVRCRGVRGVSFILNDLFGDPEGERGCWRKLLSKGSTLHLPPRFVNHKGDDRDYRLASSSHLIDAGSNEKARGLEKDLAGEPRVIDGGHGPYVDIGAYEYVPD